MTSLWRRIRYGLLHGRMEADLNEELGLALRIGLAAGATRVISHLLFGVTAFDVVTFAGVATLLSIAAFIACWLPARRAATVDPLIALREL